MLSILESPYFVLATTVTFIIWFSWLTIWFLRSQKLYKTVFKNRSARSLEEILEGILSTQKISQKHILELEKRISDNEEKESWHLQKVGLLRFNPFSDTGGEQSFILALLDYNNNGLVISSLFSRSGNRWYVKKVKKGKGEDLELSEEEKKAIEMAK